MTTLKIGDAAPVFNCLDEKGNSISLDNYKGKKLVLFFYRYKSINLQQLLKR